MNLTRTLADSAMMQQHARWVASRARLMGKTPAREQLRRLIPALPPPAPEPEPRERDWLIIASSLPPDAPIPPPGPMIPHWKLILREVSLKHNMGITDLISIRRDKFAVAARHEAMFRMKTETSMSLPQIGLRMGGRDHTTVIHGLRRYELLRAAEAAS